MYRDGENKRSFLSLRPTLFLLIDHMFLEHLINPQMKRSGMNVLITGGVGFIGSHLADALIDRGYSVAIVDNLLTGNKANLPRQARLYRADYSNVAAMRRIFRKEKPSAVFHLAARISVRESQVNPLLYVQTDLLGSMRLIDVAKQHGVKKFIFSSTGGVMYGEADTVPIAESAMPRPSSPYAMNKLFIEQYLLASGVPAVALRYANVYGPRQNPQSEAGVIAIFSERLLRGQQPVIHNQGKTTRDYMFVSDVVAANIMAFENDAVLGVYNIGTGRETDVNHIFGLINQEFDGTSVPVYKTEPVQEIRRSALSSEKFQSVTGWQPRVSLEEGIPRAIDWYKRQQATISQPLYKYAGNFVYRLTSFL